MKFRKRQTAVKGRFSAILISTAVHVAVLIAAGTFVAVTVVQRQEARFEGRQVSRPRMQLQRLQVPQRARMERQAPQMSQRVTAQAISTRSVEFQMPEIAGLGGGISVDMSGAGFSGSLGFATPQLNLFGLRSQGEKVVFILDTSPAMLVDEIGGITAYRIIKNELVSMIQRLPATALFNVIIFDQHSAWAYSETLVAASKDEVTKFQNWIAPLNADRQNVGVPTLASPGFQINFEPFTPVPNTQYGWPAGLAYAIQHRADTVYWLGASDWMRWIHRDLYRQALRGRTIEPLSGQPEEYAGFDFESYPGGKERWERLVEDARRKHERENERRLSAGEPAQVIPGGGGDFGLIALYHPSAPRPTQKSDNVAYHYTAEDIVSYITNLQRKYAEDERIGSAANFLRRKRFSFNVIHFIPINAPPTRLVRLQDAARRLNGEYIQIQGLEAIRSAATGSR